MPYLSSAALFRPLYGVDASGNKVAQPPQAAGYTIFSPTDAKCSGVNIASDDSTPGVNSSGYPGYTRASSTFATDGFVVGDYVRVTGAAADVNGSTAAPKVWRIAYLSGTFMGVEGAGSSSMTTVASAAGIVIRKVRLFRVADIRSIVGAAHPITVQATISGTLTGTTIAASLDDGVTWENLPKVVLPDTDNSNAQTLQFFVGYEALLMVVPNASYTGIIRAA